MNDLDFNEIRNKHPKYRNWSDERLKNAINRKRESQDTEKGWGGVANDVSESLQGVPDAIANMVYSIPGGIEKSVRYALTHNPVETLGNLGAGGIEAGAQLLSGPQVAARYIGEKFPAIGNWMERNAVSKKSNYKTPTLYEKLMKFEKEHGLGARGEDEESIRNAGGLLFGGKYLSKTGAPAGIGSLALQQAGAGGDALHAALLGTLGHVVSNVPWKKAAPSNLAQALKNIPEMIGKGTAAALEKAADVGYKFHIPGAQPTLGALSAYIKHKSVSPEKFAQRQLFGDIEDADLPLIKERLAAAKRLKLDYLTPAESTLSPFEGAKQGDVGRTPPGSKLMLQKGRERLGSETASIHDLLDSIYKEENLAPEMKKNYKETMEQEVPDEFVEKHKNDPVIEEAIRQLHNDPIYRKSLGIEKASKEAGINPKSTFEYWDHVKRILGDMEESNNSGEGRKPFKKSVIEKTRNQMVSEMDAIEPKYKTARNIAERGFTRNELESFFDKRKMTGNNLYKFLESKKNFDWLMDKLHAFPEIQSKIRDMKKLYGDLIPGDISIRGAAALKRTGMSEPRNKLDALKRALDEKYGREHDVATVKLMTHPDWLPHLLEHLKNK